jgi:hypothetical protein
MNIGEYYLFFYKMMLYFLTIPLLTTVFWFWLTYVDRVHIRVKSKELGLIIQKTISDYFSENTVGSIKKYCYKQINTIGEIVAGFSDGLLNKKSAIDFKYVCDVDSQTYMTCIEQKNDETQTNIIELIDIETNTDAAEITFKNINENEENKNGENKEENKKEESISSSSSEDTIVKSRKLFKKRTTLLGSSILEKDLEEDRKNIIKQQKRRITIKRNNR